MAKFNFENLDGKTRDLMMSEINADVEQDRLYMSGRLNEVGQKNYRSHLENSVSTGDEETFEKLLNINTHFNPKELKNGKLSNVPLNASTLLCQNEFNRFYIRAICLRAIEEGKDVVKIYRARESSWSRPESEAKIGNTISAKDLLEDLRTSIGGSPKLFPEINSGLSVKL